MGVDFYRHLSALVFIRRDMFFMEREVKFWYGFVYISKMNVQNIWVFLWVVGSTCAFVTMQLFIKLLAADVSSQYIVCLRSILLLLINSYFVFSSQDYKPYALPIQTKEEVKFFSLNIKSRKLFVLMMKRLFWNAVAINSFLNSLKYIDLSIGNALLNTTPVLTFFVEAVFYKKPIKFVYLSLSVVCFIGVLLILNPFKASEEQAEFNWYLVLPLVSAFANCLNFLYLHELRGEFKETVVLEYTYIFHLLSSSLLMCVVGQSTAVEYIDNDIYFKPKFYIFVAAMIFFAYTTHFLRIKALFKKKPSEILAFNYIGIIYSLAIDFVLFQHQLEWTTIIGVLLTGTGLLSKFVMDLFQKDEKS